MAVERTERARDEELDRIVDKLCADRRLSVREYERLVALRTPRIATKLARRAWAERLRVYGDAVFIRGLIEVTSYCKNDCLYCGIRRSNRSCARYRLLPGEIMLRVEAGYGWGFRSFVLQGGEDPQFGDHEVAALVARIKKRFPDAAVTLSLGERPAAVYRAWHEAGADRYLLRHETANPDHYARLHPSGMRLETRLRSLHDARAAGFAVGCGFMVGSPGQTAADLASDLKFVEGFRPEMCGIGPFIPHRDTPFADEAAGSMELTCYALSIIRLMLPGVLLPATTALATVAVDGRERGIRAGANVVMPNLSPPAVRKGYVLYNGKLTAGAEDAEHVDVLRAHMKQIGCNVVVGRGDPVPA